MRTRAKAGDAPIAQHEGRKLLGHLMEQMRLSKSTQGKLQRTLADGTVVIARFDGTTPTVEIHGTGYTAPRTGSAAEGIEPWVPRGFVVYPANAVASAGWGFPAVPVNDDDVGPYDPPNLAPGLDVERWTAGGPLGQVLITQRPAAGYATKADDLLPPMYFHAEVGLRADGALPGAAIGAWTAYRVEFSDFTAQSPDADELETVGIIAFKRGIFERVNAYRVNLSLDALALPMRGHYDSAQATAECMRGAHISGHFSQCFPPTYRTTDDRYTKDGMRHTGLLYANIDSRNQGGGENVIGKAFPPVTQVGTDPNGVAIWDMPNPAPAFTAQEAFDAWLASPPHHAVITSSTFNISAVSASTTQIGLRQNFAAQHFVPHDQWIHCGNRCTHSRYGEIPIVSWFGFASINLGWETLPVTFDNSPAGGNGTVPAAPFLKTLEFVQDDVNGTPYCWLRYNFDDGLYPPPAMDRCVFMRGRVIAIAPHKGLVWAAAVQRHESALPNTLPTYRLVILAHHAADQPDDLAYGMTSYLRVWYCDMPPVSRFAANPQSLIRGVYGEEDEGYPWDQKDSPFSWRGGELIDVGTTDGSTRNLLKYDSQWVFDSEGRRAICLRSTGTLAHYTNFNTPLPNAPNGAHYRQLLGRQSSALMLTIGGAVPDAPVVTKEWLGNSAANTARAYRPADYGTAFTVTEAVTAAGFDADDAPVYCFTAEVRNTNSAEAFAWVDTAIFRMFRWSTEYNSQYVYGDAARAFHRSYALDGDPVDSQAAWINVADVRDRVVTMVGTGLRHRYQETSPGSGTLVLNTDYTHCWANNATDDVIKVVSWRGYDETFSRWYPNPDNAIPALINLCFRHGSTLLWIGTRLPSSINHQMVASYARRGEDWVSTMVVKPQNAARWYRLGTPTPGLPNCTWGACEPSASALTLTFDRSIVFATRDGAAASSFADQAALMALTQTPGGSARFLYARVV